MKKAASLHVVLISALLAAFTLLWTTDVRASPNTGDMGDVSPDTTRRLAARYHL
jgi:hypothetical protein